MHSEHGFLRYISAFNAGNSESCGSFSTPSITFRNSPVIQLRGADAVIAYFGALKQRTARRMEVRAVIAGEDALLVALHSRFEILSPREPFAGELLEIGDVALLDSIALYKLNLNNALITPVEAKTLLRQIIRAREA